MMLKNRGFTYIYTIPAEGGEVKRLTGGENSFLIQDGAKMEVK